MRSLLAVSLLVFTLLGSAWSAGPESERLITVTGTGEVTADPDVATFQIGATTDALQAQRCYSDNSEIMNAVRAALMRLGIKKEDIRTVQFNLSPRYEYPGGGARKFVGYQMTHLYSVKVRNFDVLGDALDAATLAGANEISNIGFALDDPKELQSQARVLAVKDAESKAKTLASAAGATLLRVLSITEGSSYIPQPAAEYRKMEVSAVAPVEPGTRTIVVNVNVVYEIE